MFSALRKRQWDGRIGTFVLEVFSVVLAVFIALAANDWRDSRTAQALTCRSAAAIAEELRSNLDAVVQAHSHHGDVLDKIRGSLPQGVVPSDEEALALYRELYQSGIFQRGSVIDAAWETAQSSGATQGLEFGLALNLSKTYAIQTDYRQLSQSVGHAANLAQFLGATPVYYLTGIYEGVNDYWWHEKLLIEAYEESLRALERSDLLNGQ